MSVAQLVTDFGSNALSFTSLYSDMSQLLDGHTSLTDWKMLKMKSEFYSKIREEVKGKLSLCEAGVTDAP